MSSIFILLKLRKNPFKIIIILILAKIKRFYKINSLF